jgi:cytidylate kinase
LYNVDPRDPELYHLVIDSTVVQFDTCVELIARAAALQ